MKFTSHEKLQARDEVTTPGFKVTSGKEARAIELVLIGGVQRGNERGDALLIDRVLPQVNANDHELLERDLDAPELTAQLAVHLNGYLGYSRPELLLIREQCFCDYLRWNTFFARIFKLINKISSLNDVDGQIFTLV